MCEARPGRRAPVRGETPAGISGSRHDALPRIQRSTRLRSSDESTLRWRDVTIGAMQINELGPSLVRLFSELVDGAPAQGDVFMLNSGDPGLLRCLDRLSATEASQSTDGGATIAAHAQHVRYGLSLMNQWAAEGGNPFANAKWDEAWRVSTVDAAVWDEIRSGLRAEAHGWLETLNAPRELRARGTDRHDLQRRPPGVSPRRDPPDQQEPQRSEGRHVHPRSLGCAWPELNLVPVPVDFVGRPRRSTASWK